MGFAGIWPPAQRTMNTRKIAVAKLTASTMLAPNLVGKPKPIRLSEGRSSNTKTRIVMAVINTHLLRDASCEDHNANSMQTYATITWKHKNERRVANGTLSHFIRTP